LLMRLLREPLPLVAAGSVSFREKDPLDGGVAKDVQRN